MPKLYHSFVSGKSDASDASLVRPSNWNDSLQYANSAGTGPSGTPAIVRESLTADRTYYVRTDGSDSNNGLADTSGGAFLTIQKAIDVVANLDVNGFDVNIQVGDGTYTQSLQLKNYVGSTSSAFGARIVGNLTTPANVVISVNSVLPCVNSEIASPWHLTGFKFTNAAATSGGGIQSNVNGIIFIGKLDCGSCSYAHFATAYNGTIIFTVDYTISASGGGAHCVCAGGAFAHTAYPTYGPITITASGTISHGGAFVNVDLGGVFESYQATFSGTFTGSRYSIVNNGVIQTYGGGASYFPGDAAGTTATGGVYS